MARGYIHQYLRMRVYLTIAHNLLEQLSFEKLYIGKTALKACFKDKPQIIMRDNRGKLEGVTQKKSPFPGEKGGIMTKTITSLSSKSN